MADLNEPESTGSEEQDAPAKSAGTAKRRPAPTPAPAPAQSSTGPLLIAAAVGLVAGLIGGGAVAALWPSGGSSAGGSAKFSSEQVNDAKKDVCGAVVLARQAVANNMHMKNPDPENPVAQLAVAANARLSLTAGAAYLRGRLEADPATPQDIVDSTQKMAGALERLNLSYLVGQPNTEREQLGHDLDSHITALGKLCQ
ncbi:MULTISPECIES: hypothetical protein [Mycolicibacter]|uniref:Alanine and proline rich membrane protein n=1 Tax=Mycolicibacter virginiensis TaxID=1795032 RepID=A0A9X7IJ19_9MYCO|nr:MULTISPECIES: hypothetical protein [Mycobacteriaceae]OBJ30398.1 hypothetical protein A5631_14365 [Mycolicibacter heraklionensis]PQM49904.1 hypothetical protein C5U48_22975 [Mycolicibacter virginiensis]ULP47067.1 hypothetical protein MJO54_20195 [Mycolicibacter virginiensis]